MWVLLVPHFFFSDLHNVFNSCWQWWLDDKWKNLFLLSRWFFFFFFFPYSWDFVLVFVWMKISGGAITLSQDAKGEGKETFLADEFSILLCGWRDAFYVGGNFSWGNHIIAFFVFWSWGFYVCNLDSHRILLFWSLFL